MAKTGLGKGFGSLLPDTFDTSVLLDKEERVQKVLIQDIIPNPDQPRRDFDPVAIDELSSSIKKYGILQPIVLTDNNGNYMIVAGERRYHAAKKAGLTHIPALIRSTQDLERLEIGLIENMQRVDLSPLEQAMSVVRLHDQFNLTHKQIAERLGKAHSTIANIVRLLQLPDFAQKALNEGLISEGHARAVLNLKSEELQKELIENIEHNNWSVRRAEQFVVEKRDEREGVKTPAKTEPRLKINKVASKQLSTKYGFKVTVAHKSKGGKIAMEFATRKQLEEFLEFLENQKINKK